MLLSVLRVLDFWILFSIHFSSTLGFLSRSPSVLSTLSHLYTGFSLRLFVGPYGFHTYGVDLGLRSRTFILVPWLFDRELREFPCIQGRSSETWKYFLVSRVWILTPDLTTLTFVW